MQFATLRRFFISMVVIAGSVFSAVAYCAQSTDTKAFLADVTNTNAGLELVTPYIDYGNIDANNDGLPDSVAISFSISKLGNSSGVGASKLYSSSPRTYTNIQFPCDINQTAWLQVNEENAVLRDGKYALFSDSTSIACIDTITGEHVAYKTAIFKADVSVTNGASELWSYDYNLAGISLVDDMNANGYKEVMLVLTKENTSTGGEDYLIVIRDISNGQIISSSTIKAWVP